MAKNYTPNQNNRQAYDTLTEGAATLPPQAVELEEAVLGALMLEGDSITTVQEFLIGKQAGGPAYSHRET